MMRLCYLLLLVIGLCAWPPLLRAEPPYEQMQASVVKLCCASDPDPRCEHSTSGTGFYIGEGEYLMTSEHVARCAQQGEPRGNLFVQETPHRQASLELLDYSKTLDLALLKPSKRRRDHLAATFAEPFDVKQGDEVFTFAYAAPGELTGNVYQAALTSGRVGRIARDEESGVRAVQIDVAVAVGSSGSPLFDREGRVVGVINRAAATEVDGQLVTLHGVAWAIDGREVQAWLSEVLREPVSAVVAPSWNLALLLGLGAVVLALLFSVFRAARRGAPAVSVAVSSHSRSPQGAPTPASLPAVVQDVLSKWELLGVSGHFAGAEVSLGGGPVVIGRDPRVAQLVYPQSLSVISKRHCVVTLDSNQGQVFIEDCWSANGTYLQDGTRIEPGVPRRLPANTEFYCGTPEQVFRVRG